MKAAFYLNGKKATRKSIKEIVGAERLTQMVKEAKEAIREDPLIENDFFIGRGMLTIQFEE